MGATMAKYYDFQEFYDDLTFSTIEQTQEEMDKMAREKVVLNMLRDGFPNRDAEEILEHIVDEMDTFKAIAQQYKDNIGNERQVYKEVLLLGMGSIMVILKPYEREVYYLYPEQNCLMHSVHMWYLNYIQDNKSAVKA
jgi:hypothetical protein